MDKPDVWGTTCKHDRVSKNGRCLRPGCRADGLTPTGKMKTKPARKEGP